MPLGHLSKLHVAPVDSHQASVDVWTCQPWSPQPDLLRNTAFPIEGMKQKNFSSIRHPSLLCLEGLGETNLDQRKPKTSSKFFIFKGRFLHLPSLPWNFGMEIWISFGDLALSRKVHWPARWNDTTSLKCQTVVNQLICPKLRSSIFFHPWTYGFLEVAIYRSILDSLEFLKKIITTYPSFPWKMDPSRPLILKRWVLVFTCVYWGPDRQRWFETLLGPPTLSLTAWSNLVLLPKYSKMMNIDFRCPKTWNTPFLNSNQFVE